MKIKMVAIAPYDGWAFITQDEKLYMLKPPFRNQYFHLRNHYFLFRSRYFDLRNQYFVLRNRYFGGRNDSPHFAAATLTFATITSAFATATLADAMIPRTSQPLLCPLAQLLKPRTDFSRPNPSAWGLALSPYPPLLSDE